ARAGAAVDLELAFFEARRELIERDGNWRLFPASPTTQVLFAARVPPAGAADVRSALVTRRLEAPRVRVLSGQPVHVSALTQHAYLADVLFTDHGAEPEVNVFTTGVSVSATATAREGVG